MKKLIIFTVTLLIGQTATCMDIFEAVKAGNLGRVQELINENPEIVNAQNDWQWTPLHIAAMWGHTDIAQLVLDGGADINAQTHQQETPLHIAISYDHVNIVTLLLKRGANINAQTDQQRTPLHFAAVYCHVNIAQFLLDRGANVNAQDNFNATPLHITAINGCADVATVLLDHNAAVDALDNQNQTPLHRAISMVHAVVKQLLEDWPIYQSSRLRQLNALATFYLAQHPRCGQNSPARILPIDVFRWIGELITLPLNTPQEIHQIAEQERTRERGLLQQNNSRYSIQ